MGLPSRRKTWTLTGILVLVLVLQYADAAPKKKAPKSGPATTKKAAPAATTPTKPPSNQATLRYTTEFGIYKHCDATPPKKCGPNNDGEVLCCHSNCQVANACMTKENQTDVFNKLYPTVTTAPLPPIDFGSSLQSPYNTKLQISGSYPPGLQYAPDLNPPPINPLLYNPYAQVGASSYYNNPYNRLPNVYYLAPPLGRSNNYPYIGGYPALPQHPAYPAYTG